LINYFGIGRSFIPLIPADGSNIFFSLFTCMPNLTVKIKELPLPGSLSTQIPPHYFYQQFANCQTKACATVLSCSRIICLGKELKPLPYLFLTQTHTGIFNREPEANILYLFANDLNRNNDLTFFSKLK
jgi:hypothetical protein